MCECTTVLQVNTGSYMSDRVLLNLLNELKKRDKMQAYQAFYRFFTISLIHSIIQEQEY